MWRMYCMHRRPRLHFRFLEYMLVYFLFLILSNAVGGLFGLVLDTMLSCYTAVMAFLVLQDPEYEFQEHQHRSLTYPNYFKYFGKEGSKDIVVPRSLCLEQTDKAVLYLKITCYIAFFIAGVGVLKLFDGLDHTLSSVSLMMTMLSWVSLLIVTTLIYRLEEKTPTLSKHVQDQ